MLDDAADVIQREVRQSRIAIAGKQVGAILPHRLMHVHAGAVVADHRLGHESRRLAVACGHVPHRVLQDLHPVGAPDQGRELGADFALPGRRHFVVVHFDLDTLLLEQQAHFGADILQRVGGRHREVAALDRSAMREIARLIVDAGRPGRLFALDLNEAARHVEAPGHRIENEELGLGAKVGSVAQTRGLQVRLGAARE